jgi:aspartate/methionine/tyrosine aminotransferase
LLRLFPGDEVIFFEPAFDSYAPMIRLQGATPVAIKLSPADFSIPWDEVSARLSPRTRMIVINSPHNPTGAILGSDDIAALERLTAGTGIIILSDEVYEHMVFDGAPHHSMSRHSALAERSIVVGSFGKSFHVTGWRVGYCLAPAVLMGEIRKLHQFAMYCADTPMQIAFAKLLAFPEHYLSLSQLYQEKRDFLVEALGRSRLKLRPSAGGFFLIADYTDIADEPDSGFVKRLITDHQVATLPVSAFYGDGTDHRLIRLSFSKTIETLREGAAKLCQL